MVRVTFRLLTGGLDNVVSGTRSLFRDVIGLTFFSCSCTDILYSNVLTVCGEEFRSKLYKFANKCVKPFNN